MKKSRTIGVFLFALAACLSPRGARAQPFILDTGTPTSGTYPILSNSQWFAAEFVATAGETITALSAYLTSMSGNGDHGSHRLFTASAPWPAPGRSP